MKTQKREIMKKIMLHIIAVTLMLFTFSGSLFAQTSTIEGYIKNGEEGAPYVGVSVYIVGIGRSTTTDGNGYYIFNSIETGTLNKIAIATIGGGPAGWQRTIQLPPTPGIFQVDFWLDAVSDIDGNNYTAIEIGTQVWMGENLVTNKLNDGTSITLINVNGNSSTITTPVYCQPYSGPPYPYGNYYNWYAVNAGKLCPTDWHEPSNYDWNTLTTYLGGSALAGGKLKEAGLLNWASPNTGATNESGFTAIAGGYISTGGGVNAASEYGFFYSSTEGSGTSGYNYTMFNNNSTASLVDYLKYYLVPVRCVKDYISTNAITSITTVSAQSGGNITDDGGSPVTARGICWSISPNPTVDLPTRTSDGTGIGSFSSNISGLATGTTYYVRAYATNSGGTKYGNEISFTTLPDSPTVTTAIISDITPISAIGGGNVTSDGGSPVTVKGIVWNTHGNPQYIVDSGCQAGSMGTGSFVAYVSSVLPSATYHVRAFAVNAVGVAYGEDITFTTTQSFESVLFNQTIKYGTVEDIDGNTYKTIQIGPMAWTAENLKTTRFNNGLEITNITDQTQWESQDGTPGNTTPAYCWYDNNAPICKDVFGALYNWNAASNDNLCPVSWRVPTDAEWTNLFDYLGGINNAGNFLKETGIAHWATPNPGATNSTGFTALGGGVRGTGAFSSVAVTGFWWSRTGIGASDAYNINLNSGSGYVGSANNLKKFGMSIRCIKEVTLPTIVTSDVTAITAVSAASGGTIVSDGGAAITERGICWSTSENPTTADKKAPDNAPAGEVYSLNLNVLLPNTHYYVRAYATNSAGTVYGNQLDLVTHQAFDPIIFNPGVNYGTVADPDGNNYRTVHIGTQEWMAENLKTTRYNDNTAIPNVNGNTAWSNLSTPGYCWYDDNITLYGNIFGALYNWHAIHNGKLCPSGWRVPSKDDWNQLSDYLGGTNLAGGKLKETGMSHWENPNTGADNQTGFTALPGGLRSYDNGISDALGLLGFFWSSTENDASTAWYDVLGYSNNHLSYGYDDKKYGYSVRCIKDISNSIVVTNVDDSGTGSLRDAINTSNSSAGVLKTINFNIPGTGPFTIKPQSPLPELTSAVTIDGYSQYEYMLNLADTSMLIIRIDGTNAGQGSNGLTINSSNCTINRILITNFSGDGIRVVSGTGNHFELNSIYGNGGLGINLGTDGVTPNDPGDVDIGPNNLQNYPVLTSVSFSPGQVTINGSLASEPVKSYELQFFASNVANKSGYGEGQTFIGYSGLTTDPSGNGTFSVTFPINSSNGQVITAIVRGYDDHNTSEFSKAVGGAADQEVGTGWPLKYMYNDKITDGTFITAVTNSFQTWQAIPTATITFENDLSTPTQYAAIDGTNLVSFADDQFDWAPGVLAYSAKTVEMDADGKTGHITDADIIVNPKFASSLIGTTASVENGTPGYYDIQSIITHEIGHILGLLHSGLPDVTMFPWVFKGTTAERTLEPHDVAWASCKYPGSGYSSTYGTITGNIKYGYAPNPMVAGALVTAINPATNVSFDTYSDADGHYVVPVPAPANYYIYIQPLDGDVNGYPMTPGNVSNYISSNTVYTDYPNEYYNSNDSNIESEDSKTMVAVTAGNEKSGIDIWTNQDVTPPTVVSITPNNGLPVGVMPDIIIKFSEPVDMTSITDPSCYLQSGGNKYYGSVTELVSGKSDIIIFTPNVALAYNTTFTLQLIGQISSTKKGITDLKGNALSGTYPYSIKTVQKDVTAPVITSTIPTNGATGVSVTNNIIVCFSKSLNKPSVEAGLVLSGGGNSNISGQFSWNSDNTTVTFDPTQSLSENTKYTVTLPSSISDLNGNLLGANKSFAFTTVTSAGPQIIYRGPVDGRTDIAVTTPVVVDFTEPIDPLTVDQSSFMLLLNGSTIDGSFEFLNDNSRVVFRPDADLDFGKSYSITLTNAIKDVSQPNPQSLDLQNKPTTTFTTSATPSSPSIKSIEAPSGASDDVVIIAGEGFDPNPENNLVTFVDIPAHVIEATLNSLKVYVPQGAISGLVTVSVKGAKTDPGFDFIVIPKSLDTYNVVSAKIPVGTNSNDVAITPGGETAYITNSGSNSVSVINMTTLSKTADVLVGNTPLKIDINPTGTRAYVTNYGSNTVSVIRISDNTVEKEIKVGINPYGIAVNPNGQYVYVSNYSSQDISVIDANPKSGGYDYVVANVNTGTNNKGAAVTGDAGLLLVAGAKGLTLVNIDPDSKNFNCFNCVVANASSETKTKEVAAKGDATYAIVTTEAGILMLVDVLPQSDFFGTAVAATGSGSQINNGKPRGDGLSIYATNANNDVLVFQINPGGAPAQDGGSVTGIISLKLIATIPSIGNRGLVFNTDNEKLLVVNSGTGTVKGSLVVINLQKGPIPPAIGINGLIIIVQDMISNGAIPRLRGYALIITLNSALRNVNKSRPKLAIADLNAFITLVNTYIRNKQINATQGNALVSSAKAIIAQLPSTKSEENIPDTTYVESPSDHSVITESKLGVIYPNPTQDAITINYEVCADDVNSGKVMVQVFDVTGKLISNLVNTNLEAGRYTVTWKGYSDNGTQASRGVYFIRFTAGTKLQVKQVMMIR